MTRNWFSSLYDISEEQANEKIFSARSAFASETKFALNGQLVLNLPIMLPQELLSELP